MLYEWLVSYDARNIALFVLVEFFEKKIEEKEIKRRNIFTPSSVFSHVLFVLMVKAHFLKKRRIISK